VNRETPQEVANRSGLASVRYRVGGYPEFLASLHARLGESDGLPELTTRDSDDFTVGLLDGVACVAEVLTFYSERLVNESFLRTALDRVSLAELGKLVGYRLRPGVAAATHLAFHVQPPPGQQVTAATTPFQRVRVAASVVIEAGTAVRSVPGPGETQQTFETAERVEARPPWNLLVPLGSKKTVLGTGSKSMSVKGVATGLRPGDQLLFASSLSTWASVPVTAVVPGTDSTLVSWQTGLTKAGPLTPYVFRKRLAVFGHNAPMWGSMSSTFRADYRAAVLATGWEGYSDWPDRTITPSGVGQAVDVEGPHPDIAVGSYVMLARPGARALFEVSKVEELSRSEFAVSGKVTRVYLTGSAAEYNQFAWNVRETTVFAVNDKLDLADEPDTSPVKDNQVTVAGDVSQLPPGRVVLVSSPAGTQVVALKSAVASAGNTVLTFAENLKQQHNRALVNIFGNVAAATHGETVHQILGDGAAQPFQRFELKHSPLTYVPSDGSGGARSTLEVRVNDALWQEKPTHHDAGPGERSFVTREGTSGEVVVEFGDGARGARPPTGQHNVRAKYRKGIGTAGNLPTGALTQLSSPPLGVTGVTNPVPAEGGADPDSAELARTGIPRSTRTLGRAVSLTDYADYASTFAGIAKAHALVLPVRNIRTIVVTVASSDKDNLAGDQVRARLAESLRGYGDPLAPVLVLAHRPAWFTVKVKLLVDPDLEFDRVRGAVADRLNAAFGFAERDFGAPVRKSSVIATIHRVSGVIACDLDELTRTSDGQVHELVLADGPSAAQGAELLLIKPVSAAAIGKMP
jgi:hypothetical protein